MPLSSEVEKHYDRGNFYEQIVDKLRQNGLDPAKISRRDISGADEFHVRGAAVTTELAAQLQPAATHQVLDVGCGLGGPARMLADEYGCHVTGIDLTEAFISGARSLSALVGLDRLNTFIQGDALQLPFEDAQFDIVWTLHVQMNIKDKEKFYSEIARVLKPGGRFAYYDIFRTDDQAPLYPLPWSDSPAMSFLVRSSEVQKILVSLGLSPLVVTDQTPAAIRFFSETAQRIAKEGPPRLGLDLVMGPTGKEKLGNLMKNLAEGHLGIESAIFEKR